MKQRRASVHIKQSPFKTSSSEADNSSLKQTPFYSPPLNSRKLTVTESSKLFEDFGPVNKCNYKDAFSGDFKNSNSESFDTCSTAVPSISCLTKSHSLSQAMSEEFFEESKVYKSFRGMVIGSKNSGKHFLVNAICPESNFERSFCPKQEFDLLARKIETDTIIKRYHFWLKEANKKLKFNFLLPVYYRDCKMFFFVYNTNDASTFKCLDREIHLIKEANPGRNLLLVLIGNKIHGTKNIVSFREAMGLKQKHKMQLFRETDLSKESLQDIQEVINCLAK